jgi:hypothetical protein
MRRVLAFIASPRAPSLIHRFIAGLYAVNGAGCGNRSMRAATEHQLMRSMQGWSIASSCRGKIFFAFYLFATVTNKAAPANQC